MKQVTLSIICDNCSKLLGTASAPATTDNLRVLTGNLEFKIERQSGVTIPRKRKQKVHYCTTCADDPANPAAMAKIVPYPSPKMGMPGG